MVPRTIKRLLYTALGATGVGLALTALFLLSLTAQNVEDFDRLHTLILLINVAGILVLLAFLIGNLARLWRDYRDHVPGAKLKARMVGKQLEYRPLSQRYIVRNTNSGDQDSFATLYSALNTLGRIQGLPVVDDSILQPDKSHRIRLRARLSTEQYPAPLRILFFWRDQWQLESEWFEWLLER